jgi:hypothetical protein
MFSSDDYFVNELECFLAFKFSFPAELNSIKTSAWLQKKVKQNGELL